MIKLARN